ncbi:hypothetical protein [Aminipila terrae]|uniref:Uncharacterized protein n=1 Tax=Aminipila terrae TaxID=2697030 RepID=A0A6P1MIB0_9FIRM|nr:hypothetical protein [Aminipila terrae]QHI73802.1 hypothetical protein Ami3637_16695 [Aminipila terrae]
MKDKDIKSFTVEYEDGEKKSFEKGFMVEIRENVGAEDATVTFNMCGIGGQDLYLIISSVIQFGNQIGFFDKI